MDATAERHPGQGEGKPQICCQLDDFFCDSIEEVVVDPLKNPLPWLWFFLPITIIVKRLALSGPFLMLPLKRKPGTIHTQMEYRLPKLLKR